MRRLLVLTAGVLALAAVSWMVAVRVESPEQAAARAEAPRPAPVVARLESGRLQETISLSATTGLERKVPVIRTAADGEVVTAVHVDVGDELRPAGVLLRANGRPLFVLPGAFQFYRDLAGGDEGDDVAQLQRGLQAGGYHTGRDQIGTFGAGTKAALERMYEAAGFDPPNDDSSIVAEIAAIDGRLAAGESNPGLRRTRSDLVARLGARGRMAELAIAAQLPAVVEAITPVGTALRPGEPAATVGAGAVVLTATVPASAASAIVPGATGEIADPSRAQRTAVVRSVAPSDSPDESIVTMTSSGPLQPNARLVVRLDNPGAEAEEHLLAPVAAVVTRGGRSYIYRRAGSQFDEVEVRVQGTSGGVAAIEPVKPEQPLEAGTEVRVGTR